MIIQYASVPLSKLLPGDGINVRATGADAGLAALVASIKQHGQIQPLRVRPAKDGKDAYEIVDGRRRYMALLKIHKRKDAEVDVAISDDADAGAREISLAANVVREALHPVDEYDAYRRFIDEGATAAEVAAHFGVKEKWVRQRLQLASLAPELREAWRLGKVTADQAEALSASPDHERQARVWREANRNKHDDWSKRPASLRQEMVRGGVQQKSPKALFVGLDAYLAAGGRLSEDLFSDAQLLIDEGLLEDLAAKKLEDACEHYRSLGWSWVCTGNTLDCFVYELGKLDLEPWMTEEQRQKLPTLKTWSAREAIVTAASERAAADPEARAKSGVVIGIGNDGELSVDLLRTKPVKSSGDGGDEEDDSEDDAPLDAPATARAEDDAPIVNFALRETLSEQITVALSRVLSQTPQVALAVLLTSLRVSLASFSPIPLRIATSGVWDVLTPPGDHTGLDWAAEFERARMLPIDDQINLLAIAAAKTLDLRHPKVERRVAWDSSRDRITEALAAALPAAKVTSEIAEAFDAEAYFKKVSAARCVEVITEMSGGAEQSMSKKKADLVAHAKLKAKAQGWLPPELRTAHYRGPGRSA